MSRVPHFSYARHSLVLRMVVVVALLLQLVAISPGGRQAAADLLCKPDGTKCRKDAQCCSGLCQGNGQFGLCEVSTTTITLDAVDSGFYRDDGVHASGDYAVGWYTNSIPNNVELRDYFVFDLSTVSRTIKSAFLHLSTAPPGFIRYGSDDPSETFTLFDVSTALPTLTGSTGGVSAFDDLGGGASYGDFVAPSAIGETVDVNLSAAGIAFLAANAGHQIAIGGAITTLAKGSTSEFLFNSTDASLTRQLVIITQ